MSEPIDTLDYIANSPAQEQGGFHPTTVAAARWALTELATLRQRAESAENQLVYISNFLKKDARDVRGDGEHTIAALVSQEFSQLTADLTAAREECERLRNQKCAHELADEWAQTLGTGERVEG